ncbi:MAG TPA: tetratricopeptide repeat protein [Bacteroidia bacterium]|jgi:tetratricopeptide (TPR) repeat protein|nr:tetratricopeptide repeat protein [Bacteroidia bacterium]
MKRAGIALLTKQIFLICLCCGFLFCTQVYGQAEKKYLREGNKLYSDKKYKEAEEQYQKARDLNPGNFKGAFNQADAYYKQGKNKEAATQFEELAKTLAGDNKLSSAAYHNQGNALLKDKKYEEAITAYKKALTLNPADDDTRYNLAYAQQMLKQQQNQDKKNNKDQKNKDKDKDKKDQDKKDKNKDKKDQDKDKDKKDKDKKDQGKDKDDKKKDQDKDKDKSDNKDKQKDQPKDKPQPSQANISKDAAQKMLNEMNNNERKIQAKLKKQKEPVRSATIEKDW